MRLIVKRDIAMHKSIVISCVSCVCLDVVHSSPEMSRESVQAERLRETERLATETELVDRTVLRSTDAKDVRHEESSLMEGCLTFALLHGVV